MYVFTTVLTVTVSWCIWSPVRCHENVCLASMCVQHRIQDMHGCDQQPCTLRMALKWFYLKWFFMSGMIYWVFLLIACLEPLWHLTFRFWQFWSCREKTRVKQLFICFMQVQMKETKCYPLMPGFHDQRFCCQSWSFSKVWNSQGSSKRNRCIKSV